MKFIFAGTTEFGIPTLEKLMQDGHELLLCITQPDKPVGRKQQLSPSPIKVWAQGQNIRVSQPAKIMDAGPEISELKPDLLLVAAYGQIIPKEILDLPEKGSVNIHGSILPKYRGASPIQAALINGETSTGITLIVMDEKMDHGPIIATKEITITADDDFSSLYKKLSQLAALVCADILPEYTQGIIKANPQNHDSATYTKLLTKADGQIDWTHTALEISNHIRGYNPEPGTWTTLDGKLIKILGVKILNESKIELPGKLYRHADGLAVKSQDNSLLITKVQPEGKNPMSGRDFLNGIKNLDRMHFV
ncbi:MAG: methionyl-tRNA formyltransferase [Candidatus Doudnabacteria bacterium]|nr:methionyl-tRNA formyltransferase [Candidatus Doudnabacteria bacterium]